MGCPAPLSVRRKFGTLSWLLDIYPPLQLTSKVPFMITAALSVCPVAKVVSAVTPLKLTAATLLKRRASLYPLKVRWLYPLPLPTERSGAGLGFVPASCAMITATPDEGPTSCWPKHDGSTGVVDDP